MHSIHIHHLSLWLSATLMYACMCVCAMSAYLNEIISKTIYVQYTWKMKAEAQPEKNVITDLADFIYLINHRLVAYCCCCLSLKTMGIVIFFYVYVCALLRLVMILCFYIPKLALIKYP